MSSRSHRACGALLALVWAGLAQAASTWVDGPSDVQRREIELEIERNVARLSDEGALAPDSMAAVPLAWPLRAANGLADPGYHIIPNFVDHGPGLQVRDYACGNRTINNHRGTDFLIWPFSWRKMQNNQVEVVAAAAGTIVFKQNGSFDQNCACETSDSNAIYVRHADGSTAWYIHLKNNSLTPKGVGAAVAAGEYLARVGSSGCSSAPHLHFELYNAAGQLQDPYAGACNSLNGSSWWSAQRPYHDSAINALMTASAPPSTPPCPGVETTNERTQFDYPEPIWLNAFLRDVVPGTAATFRVLWPDGSVYASWTYESANFLFLSPVSHLLSGVPAGSWRFWGEFGGQTHEVPFEVAFANAGRVSDLLLGPVTTQGVLLTWGESCQPRVTSHAVYAGFIGDWDSHESVSCDAGTSFTVPWSAMDSNRYYLVVPVQSGAEGSYGQDSAHGERPQSPSPCAIRGIGTCLGDPPRGATATVLWTTDEPATSRVTYGLTPPPPTVAEDLSLVTNHSVALTDLLQCTTYIFWVSSADWQGNLATDKNHGAYYSFDTACPAAP